MKKDGFASRLVKLGVAAAAIGGTLYLFKDKLKECPKCKEAMDKAKSTLDDLKEASGSMNYSEDFEDDLSDVDELDEIMDSEADREYVSIKLSEENNHEEDESDLPEETESIEIHVSSEVSEQDPEEKPAEEEPAEK